MDNLWIIYESGTTCQIAFHAIIFGENVLESDEYLVIECVTKTLNYELKVVDDG